jgi:hypothetical protein
VWRVVLMDGGKAGWVGGWVGEWLHLGIRGVGSGVECVWHRWHLLPG